MMLLGGELPMQFVPAATSEGEPENAADLANRNHTLVRAPKGSTPSSRYGSGASQAFLRIRTTQPASFPGLCSKRRGGFCVCYIIPQKCGVIRF